MKSSVKGIMALVACAVVLVCPARNSPGTEPPAQQQQHQQNDPPYVPPTAPTQPEPPDTIAETDRDDRTATLEDIVALCTVVPEPATPGSAGASGGLDLAGVSRQVDAALVELSLDLLDSALCGPAGAGGLGEQARAIVAAVRRADASCGTPSTMFSGNRAGDGEWDKVDLTDK